MEQAFFRICSMLSHCNKNGMVFSNDKFVFAKETVEFAGFEITKEGIKPTDKYIEAIRNFPTPTNISEVRSWFGLINQVAYSFVKTEHMAPFRHLLSQSRSTPPTKERLQLWPGGCMTPGTTQWAAGSSMSPPITNLWCVCSVTSPWPTLRTQGWPGSRRRPSCGSSPLSTTGCHFPRELTNIVHRKFLKSQKSICLIETLCLSP
jgi:hypothetical protein